MNFFLYDLPEPMGIAHTQNGSLKNKNNRRLVAKNVLKKEQQQKCDTGYFNFCIWPNSIHKC